MESQTAEREDERTLSSLPAPILHHILSFLSQEEAVRTCVVSKSWRYLGSTRPNLILDDYEFRKDKKKFMYVLGRSLHVYYDQKLSIEDFNLSMSIDKPDDPDEVVSHLKKWIPIVILEMGVKMFHLSFGWENRVDFDVPSAVFESESLQELYLERCNLSLIINSLGNNKHHLKTLDLQYVCIEEEESFAKFLSSCSLIEDLFLRFCEGLRTINMPNHHNLKSFELYHNGSIEIYLPSSIGRITIRGCPNWYHHRNCFPGLTCLSLTNVPLSHEWFNSFSRNFPCLEELELFNCHGFDELQLSSRSIKHLNIWLDKNTNKATIDAPSIQEFRYDANISQSIYFTTTCGLIWKSHIRLSLDLDASLWFPKLSELIAAFSQSQISLVLKHSGRGDNQHIERLSDISVCCGGSYKMPVAMKSWNMIFSGHYNDSIFSDLLNGLFRIFRPREIEQDCSPLMMVSDFAQHRKKAVEFLCRTLQMRRWEEDGGMWSFWQHDLEEVSLQVKNGRSDEWHPVQGTISWSEYVAALLSDECRFYQILFRLKWKELANSFD